MINLFENIMLGLFTIAMLIWLLRIWRTIWLAQLFA